MNNLLVVKSRVKRYALNYSEARRGNKFTRVSRGFYVGLDVFLRGEIRRYIDRLPSVGKTIK